jgi:hypothetical protein
MKCRKRPVTYTQREEFSSNCIVDFFLIHKGTDSLLLSDVGWTYNLTLNFSHKTYKTKQYNHANCINSVFLQHHYTKFNPVYKA